MLQYSFKADHYLEYELNLYVIKQTSGYITSTSKQISTFLCLSSKSYLKTGVDLRRSALSLPTEDVLISQSAGCFLILNFWTQIK